MKVAWQKLTCTENWLIASGGKKRHTIFLWTWWGERRRIALWQLGSLEAEKGLNQECAQSWFKKCVGPLQGFLLGYFYSQYSFPLFLLEVDDGNPQVWVANAADALNQTCRALKPALNFLESLASYARKFTFMC